MTVHSVSSETISQTREYKTRSNEFGSALPFPHLVIDDFLEMDEAVLAARSFPCAGPHWTNYLHVNERKFGLSKREFIPNELLKVIDQLQSPAFMKQLSDATGVAGLIADETLAGGGLHQVQPGGFLNIHSDFLIHPSKSNLKRRLNLILFLSDNWTEEYGGELEFWSNDMKECVVKIQPKFNRCVIFETDELSYHGCPEKLRGPVGFMRNSIALYYYTEYTQMPAKLFTDYRARPFDRNKFSIWLDGKIVALYSWIKRRFKLDDDFASRVLKYIGRR